MFLSILQDTITDSEKQEICDYVYPRMKYKKQDGNLYKISRYSVSNDSPHVIKKTHQKIKRETEKIINLKLHSEVSYILNYNIGARANTHTDSHIESYVTAITFLNLSDDLEGGVSYVGRLIDGKVSRLHIPIIEKDTLLYGSKMLHGVTEITKGSRLVFVNWYKKA